jgi:hypothetical protein
MKKLILPFSLAAALLVPLLLAAPAHAQATRTWVSGVGDDANPCSRTAPCKTFAGAISKTAAGGEINCIDPGGFGAVTITKSISIDCGEGSGSAGVLASLTNGIIVNAAAADVVTLRGLDIDGVGTGLVGIRFLAGAALHVQNCTIRNFRGGSAFGIQFVPSTNASLDIVDTVITDNGTAALGGGIQIKPTGTASVSGTLGRLMMSRNGAGIVLDGSGGTGGMNITMRDSIVAGGAGLPTGITVASATSATAMMIQNSTASYYTTGIAQAGGSATVRVGGSIITGNGTGVSGTVQSYGNNHVDANGTNGTLTALALK